MISGYEPFIIVTMLVFFLLATFIVIFAVAFNRRVIRFRDELDAIKEEKEKALLQATIEAQEMERRRLGANLHDDLGPLLSGIKMHLNSLQYQKNMDSEQTIAIGRELDETMNQLRRISRDMVPAVLESFGLYEGLKELCERLARSSGKNIYYQSMGTLPELPAKKQLAIYRIFQEALNNALKHADATEMKMHLSVANNILQVNLNDNGKGFKLNGHVAGLGLSNMQARARAINADLEISSQPLQGTQLKLRIPYE